jgi:hypothetical protein
VLLNNTGLETRTSTIDTAPENFDNVLNVNLRGLFMANQLRPGR